MGSVDSLAKWLQERPRQDGASTEVVQLRLDRDSNRTLGYLAHRFGMPKATLGQEMLRAAIQDTLKATPGNVRVRDTPAAAEMIEHGGWEPDDLVHDMGSYRDSDGEGEV
jgi:hypothetical protein